MPAIAGEMTVPRVTGRTRSRRSLGVVGGFLGVLFVGFLDLETGSEVSFSIIYLVPIALAAWFGGRVAGMGAALFGAVTWYGVERVLGHLYSAPWIAVWNALVRGLFFLVVAELLNRTRFLTAHLEDLVRRRTAALDREIERRRQVEREVAEVHHWEQQRIAHELHDHLGASLAGVAFRAKAIAEGLDRRGVPEAADAGEVTRLVNESIGQVRSLSRMLASADELEGGLAQALSRLGAEAETVFGITCMIEVAPDLPGLSAEQGRHLYRIAQEAIRNAVQHGGAQLIRVNLGGRSGGVELVITGDGRHWRPEPGSGDGLGLRIMRYRAGFLGGVLEIRPLEAGGATVRCRIPLASPLASPPPPPSSSSSS